MYSLILGILLLGDTPVARDEYVFVPDTDRFVALHQGPVVRIGKLDKRGTFSPDTRWVNLDAVPAPATLRCDVLNPKRATPGYRQDVYEFRSDRLIPGQLDENGRFLPEIGGKIIEFKEYRYSPSARKIYNLPGRFVKVEAKDSKAKK